MRALKVGELAERAGLTVRTLHHYDEIGLLAPARRTSAGHRLYGEEQVVRLQQIVALRGLGFSLEDAARMLERPDLSPARVLRLRMERLEDQIDEQERLRQRLRAMVRRLESQQEVSVEEALETIGAMTMFDKYFTPEQMQKLEDRRKVVSEERIREVETEWPVLIAEVKAEMEKGTDPASERVQELARRWKGLVEEFTGGDIQIAASVGRMYQQEESARQRTGLTAEIMAYVGRASAAMNK
jgi:DNA-binding transcriptional MerR regulator